LSWLYTTHDLSTSLLFPVHFSWLSSLPVCCFIYCHCLARNSSHTCTRCSPGELQQLVLAAGRVIQKPEAEVLSTRLTRTYYDPIGSIKVPPAQVSTFCNGFGLRGKTCSRARFQSTKFTAGTCPLFGYKGLSPTTLHLCLQEWAACVESCIAGQAASAKYLSPDASCTLLHSLHFDIGGRLTDDCLHQVMQPLAKRIEECR
jgi:hypothetical protein